VVKDVMFKSEDILVPMNNLLEELFHYVSCKEFIIYNINSIFIFRSLSNFIIWVFAHQEPDIS
jgi:hypothetical protein